MSLSKTTRTALREFFEIVKRYDKRKVKNDLQQTFKSGQLAKLDLLTVCYAVHVWMTDALHILELSVFLVNQEEIMFDRQMRAQFLSKFTRYVNISRAFLKFFSHPHIRTYFNTQFTRHIGERIQILLQTIEYIQSIYAVVKENLAYLRQNKIDKQEFKQQLAVITEETKEFYTEVTKQIERLRECK